MPKKIKQGLRRFPITLWGVGWIGFFVLSLVLLVLLYHIN